MAGCQVRVVARRWCHLLKMSVNSLETLRELATRCAREGGRMAIEMRAEGLVDKSQTESKSSITDLVTLADREVERLIKSIIREQRPEDSVLGEEAGVSTGSSDFRWVIDPIDGTVNYYYQYPGWVVSVAVESLSQGLLVGAIYDPVNDHLYDATIDSVARQNQQSIQPPTREIPASLDQVLLATGFGYQSERRKQQAKLMVEVLPRIRDIRRGGAAAMDLCHLATGRVDAYFEQGLKPWDYAAGLLIARQCGCCVELLEQGNGEAVLLGARSELIYHQMLELVQAG